MVPNISGILKQQNMNNGNPPSQEQIQQQLEMVTQRFSESSSCGPSCQNDKEAERLRKLYLDAKDNVEFGNERYNDAEKNYYLFINGESWWNDYRRDKNNKSTKSELSKRNKNFINLHESVNKSVTYYNSQFNNANSINELLDNINKKLSKYEQSFSNKEKQVQTSYRKTTYYETDIKNIESAISIIQKIYFLLVLVFAITTIFFFGKAKDIYNWGIIAALVVYPFIIVDIHIFIRNVFATIFSSIERLDKKIISQ